MCAGIRTGGALTSQTVLPLVSIGLPTYNGGRFIGQSIQALQAQDYPRIEIVVADNASSDGTEEIVLSAAEADSRIRYYRHARNVGAARNFNFVLGEARGEYFVWASDHDLWMPTFLSECVAALRDRPDAVLAHPRTHLIDEAGGFVELMDDLFDIDHPHALERYKRTVWRLTHCNMVYGVGRRAAYLASGGITDVLGADHLFLAQLVLAGRIASLREPLFLRRQNRPRETAIEQQRRALDYLNPERAPGSHLASDPYRQLRDAHLRVVRRSKLRRREKIEAMIATRLCFLLRFGSGTAGDRALLMAARFPFLGPRLAGATVRSVS